MEFNFQQTHLHAPELGPFRPHFKSIRWKLKLDSKENQLKAKTKETLLKTCKFCAFVAIKSYFTIWSRCVIAAPRERLK